MDDTPEKSIECSYAFDRNWQFTTVMLGMGVFNKGARYDDEITLREEVRDFFYQHHNELYALSDAGAIVRQIEGSYAAECIEGSLAVRVAPRMAGIGMMSCGVVGDFEKMRSVYDAYRAAITTFDHHRQSQAQVTLHETIGNATLQRSELYRYISNDNETKLHYSQTLRRCMAWSALSSDLYETRMIQANMRPVPLFVRRLNHIFYRE